MSNTPSPTLQEFRRDLQSDQQADTRRLLTIDETAHKLHVSRVTVYKMLNEGILPSIAIFRARRIPSAAVDVFIDRQVRSGNTVDDGAA